MCVSISIIVWLNKTIILTKKFRKHNRIYVSSYKIKYFDLHLFLDFSSFVFSYRLWFFFHLLTHVILNFLIAFMHKIFNFHLEVF
jgi:hypothetical protein